MASANVDRGRSSYGAWERGDFSGTEWADPEIEYVMADGPSPGSWTGLAGMAESIRDWLSAWEQWWVAADEYLELDDERVLVLDRYGARGQTSGLEVAQMPPNAADLLHP